VRNKRVNSCVLILLASIPGNGHAQVEKALSLKTVLQSVRAKFPRIKVAEQEQKVAEADLVAREGGFDLQWRARAGVDPSGTFQNRRWETDLVQPTTLWGTQFFVGYRFGSGTVPVYDTKLLSPENGEFRAGIDLPILRNGSMDLRRNNLKKASLQLEVADADLKQAILENSKSASFLYWDWILSSKRYEINQELLKVAELRDVWLTERVRLGDLPKFEQEDNYRSILQRKAAVAQSERLFQKASIDLSLFLRNDQGDPILAERDQIPQELPDIREYPLPNFETSIEEALRNRPEILRVSTQGQQNLVDQLLAENQVLPRLDVQMTTARSFGAKGSAPESNQFEGALQFEFPLQNRVALGNRSRFRSTELRIDAQLRLARDQIHNEVRDAVIALQQSKIRWNLSHQEALLAHRLEEGERTRFRAGDSNILTVNLREQATADAQLREWEARTDFYRGLAAYDAALGRLPLLD
jgi:outer membrane protein TolC